MRPAAHVPNGRCALTAGTPIKFVFDDSERWNK